MKIKLASALILSAGALALGARAQVAMPTTPAPAVESAPAQTAGRVIYSPRLPSPNELVNVAGAQGLSVDKIDQTASQITVTYKSADGQLSTVAYQLLPNAGTPSSIGAVGGTVTTGTTTPVMVSVARPAPTVVYTQPDPFYAYSDPYYYPWGYYSPVSLSLGWGFGYGYGRHFGGGFYHGGGWHGHGRR